MKKSRLVSDWKRKQIGYGWDNGNLEQRQDTLAKFLQVPPPTPLIPDVTLEIIMWENRGGY